MTPSDHDALVHRVDGAIRAAIAAKGVLGKGRLTVMETAHVVVEALYGPREAFFRFDDEAKELVEFKPKDTKAA